MNSVATLTDLTPAQRRELLKMALARDLVGNRSELPPVQRAPREGRLPLSFAQERLWFIDRMEPGSAAYNIPVAWRLAGVPDVAALERALGEIVRRHEALRTVFAEADGAPVQVVAPFGGFALPVEDLSGEADREAAARRRAGEEARRPFDLAAGPLFRAALLRLGGEEHVLLLTVHHIVSDGWSMGVLYRELSALYAAYRAGGASPLPELPVQYADYALWQREHLRDAALEAGLAYWRKRLADAPALLELPTDHPRPAVQTFRGAHAQTELPGELLERLHALARGEGATLNMVLLAAFQVLLSKYSGSADIVVGSPVAGRKGKEVEELIGFFVNTVVMRTDLSGDPGFREVLRRAKEATLGAYEHQEVPFERLVAELQPERSLSHSPLFQVMFALQNAVDRGVSLPGLEVSDAGAEQESAKFDLFLTAKETAGGLRVRLNYSTDLFERGTIERMLGHLARVLEQVAADADVRLSRLELLGQAERALVLDAWNRTERPYPRGVCIHELFEAQARERPGAVALAWGGEELTYEEVDARANRLARHLARRGVGPEARVGLLLERGAELVVAILAVLKAGGCYVPLDPGYPAERLRLMMDDSGVRVLVTRGGLAGAVETGGLDVVHLDRDAAEIASRPAEAPRNRATAENLAYIVYTSGSTGRPKGIMVGHRQVVQLVVETDYVRLRPGDRVAQASNAGFDALTFELWGAFLNGATLVGIPQDVLLSPAALRQTLREQQVTTIFLTTALVNQLSHEQPDIFAPLREVLFGGQAVDADSVRRLLKAGGPQRLLHMYGPTETTTFCLYERVEHVADDALTVPLGHATGNQRIYLLDGDLSPVPRGVPGEAYVGGAGVARGYLDRPGLTAERFVPDPFSPEPGARMYRTGDRMRWRGERKLEFVGRVDDQVKIRGFRIEPGEVESALSAHPAVREARVVVRQDVPGEPRLVAYVVGGVEAEEVRAFLRGSLPEYMLPSAFVSMDALPLTPNGKVDHKALPAPELASAEDRYVAPRTPVEEVLAGIWAELLRLGRVGVEDSFFDLGGHSLLATRVVSRVRELLGVELPLRALFEGPTVAELAAAVEELRRAGLPALPPLAPAARTGALPLSFAQERLWLVDQMEEAGALYNVPAARRLTGALDVEALRRALAEIVRRHEALRTVFREVEGSLQQVIVPFAGFRVPLEDLSGLGEAEREAEAGWHAAQDATRPFDLAEGPLVRARLLRLGAEEHVLLLCLHHVASDGWSMGVLFHELSVLYDAFRERRGSPLPELEVQYADYAVWQRRLLGGDALEPHLAYWRRTLSGAPELLALPADYPRPAARTHRGAHERIELPAELLERLRVLGRGEGATLYMVLLGAFQALLSRYGAGDDVVVGTPIAGRTSRELEGLIGYFANTLVLRTELGGDPAFRDVLRRVRAATLGAYEHQEVPFDRLVAELRPERSLSHSPLFQVTFTLQDGEPGRWGLPDVLVTPVETEARFAKFDLALVMEATPHSLRARLTYATDLFERGTIRRMLGHLERVLEQVAADADVRLSGLKLAGEAERARLVEEWSPARFPVDQCIHQRFEARALERPDAPALTFEAETLTYGELNERANRLAHRLRALGVGPEARVGIALERSAELLVAILAVLKAGGAYVPLDPSYPADRTAFVLEDARIPVLVTASHLVPQLPAFPGTALCVDTHADAIARESGENPRVQAGPDSLAYVIYTSGSTGKPKGVQVTHANVARLFDATDAWFGFAADDVWTMFHSCAFDFSVWEIWGALLYGGRLVVVPFLTTRSPEDFHRLLADEGVTMLSQTPSAFKQLVQADLASGLDASALRLRCVVFGGEALDPQSLRPWMERHGDDRPRLVNMYGITETTVHVTYRVITRADLDRAGSPIGVPIPDLSLYVLDAGLEPVPAGVTGELFVGGAGVARGYLNRPELTAERFIRDPFSADPAARLYRTGDLARRRADGELEYLGRADQQVKIRGFRIETGEIEAALVSHPSLAACAVIAREDAAGERRLVAYVVALPGEEVPGVTELRAHLGETLPDFMVPAAFVPLDALPLTENGKLDRRALPAPDEARAALSADAYVPPGTATERALAEAWEEVLGVERVGIDDNYFALGGDSIRGVRLVAAARRRGLTVSIPHIYRHQTVRGLAAAAGPAGESPPVAEAAAQPFALLDPAARAGMPDDVEDAYPVSQVQLGMLYHTQRDPTSLAYHEVLSFRVHTRFDEAAMREALRRIAARHPILRSSFDLAAVPEPIQRVHRRVEIPLEVTDARTLGAQAADEWMDREKERGFDWTVAPLLRFQVQLLSDEMFRLVLVEHHVLMDGWSVASLMTELLRLFEAIRDGVDDPTGAPPATGFREFVELERRDMASAEARAFWRGVMDGAQGAALPPREGDDAPRDGDAPYLLVEFPDEIMAGLTRVAAGAGVPLKTVVLAVHLRVLAMLSGRDDVVTGYVTSGRPETEDSERALGVFLNTVPLRARLAGETWLDLVRLAWAAEEAILPHRRFPLSEIVREAGGGAPFEVGFNFVHFHVYNALAGTGVRLEGDRSFQKTEVPLAASFAVGAATGSGSLRLRLEYDPARLGDAQARALTGWYTRALAAMAERPDERWDADGLLGEAEEARLRLLGAGPAVEHEASTLPEAFERRVRLAPDAVAVVLDDGTPLTFRELDRRANRLAHHLARLGVGPEVRVGVCLERGLEWAVGLLGVLKAGGVYVPLDPSLPAERIALLLEDSAVPVVVTRSGLAGGLPEHPARVVRLDGDADALAAEPDHAPRAALSPESAAYVLYTSGSTGRPKGVVVSHGALVAHAAAVIDVYGFCPEDRVLVFVAISFDPSVEQLVAPLVAGAAVAFRGSGVWSPAELADAVERLGLTVVNPPTAYFHTLAADDEARKRVRQGARLVIVGGEAMQPATVAAWHAEPGAAELVNAYGPTEGVVTATLHRTRSEDGSRARVPIGTPLGGRTARVLDARLRIVPDGVPGELYLGGPALARGYQGLPGMTAERFVPDPYSTEPGARMYRTGDWVRRRADGTLEYLQRADAQVKIRGFRIELGEIEAALARHGAVAECAVVVRDQGSGDRMLAAYVVGEADEEELRAHLRRSLPEHMVPGGFVKLDALPLTANGKLDRRALPAPATLGRADTFVAPRDSLELRLARVWEELLGCPAVGVRDDFFALGGHSLLALRLLAAVERLTGRRVPMGALLAGPTVEQMARALRSEAPLPAAGPLVPIRAAGEELPLFFVHAAGGNVVSYAALAQHLGPRQPFYGLQSRGLEAEEHLHDRIEDMAADYLAQLRAVQKQGPYRLGGWSMGGLVAFEMARMLEAEGETVSLLALVDTRAPGSAAHAADPDEPGLLAAFVLHLGVAAGRIAHAREEIAALAPGERLRWAWEAARVADVIPAGLDLDRFERLWTVFRANVNAAAAYRPEPCSSDALLVLSEARTAPAAEVERWTALTTGNLRSMTVAGDHFGLVREPHVRELASVLTGALSPA
jgi:amino acid adenylation domain-containing protein